MLQQAQKRGAAVLVTTPRSTSVKFQGDGWQVTSLASDLSEKCRYLIAADGAKGRLATWLGFGERSRLLAGALEAEIPVSDAPDALMQMNFPARLTGYAWNFAKAGSHSIGVGMWKRERFSLRSQLDRLTANCPDSASVRAKPVVGHPLLLWNGSQHLHTERALLAGEAACMVDPWSAEGIRPAMKSGVKAAEAIGAALEGRPDALADYSESLQKGLGSEMNLARMIAAKLYSDDNSDDSAVAPADPLSLRLWSKLLCGDLNYQQYIMGNAIIGTCCGPPENQRRPREGRDPRWRNSVYIGVSEGVA